MPCLPCGGPPSETKLLARCYPPAKQLAFSEKSPQPSRQELSDLVSRLRENDEKSGQVSKNVQDVERRVQKDSTKFSDPTSRSSLLVSLSILRTLTKEFRGEIPTFAKSIIRVVNISLDTASGNGNGNGKGTLDLDCISRAISVFIAFSNHSTGSNIRENTQTFSAYLLVLRKLAGLATYTPISEKDQSSSKNRTRALGLAGVYAALGSTIFTGEAGQGSDSNSNSDSDADFGKQIRIILPPLLSNVMEADVHSLKSESLQVEKELSGDRRAPSVRAYTSDKEKAPDSTTVLRLALKSMYDLVSQCQTAQLSALVDALFDHLDRTGWQNVEVCCWIAERLTSGAMLQYRYVIPTRLVELIVGMKDVAPGPKQTTIIAMIMTVINSDISLVGLGVIYILDSLVGLVIRRIRCHPQDGLLPPLVQCISSLATHIYYPEQVNEIVEEIAYRLPDIPSSDASRPHIVRTLVHCIIGVMEIAKQGDDLESRESSDQESNGDKGKGRNLQNATYVNRSKRRTAISPDIWQGTLPLLCESTYAVRAAYARALILYIQQELPREDENQVGLGDGSAYRFCNALHATVYTLAMSCSLGTGSPPPSGVASPIKQSHSQIATPLPNAGTADPKSSAGPDLDAVDKEISKQVEKDVIENDEKITSNNLSTPTTKGVSFNVTEPTPLDTPTSTGQATPPRKSSRSSRRVSLPLNRMTSILTIESFDNVATPFDFAAILKILEELYRVVPLSAMISGVPMLLALDADAGNELIRRPGDGRNGAWVLERRRAIKETVVFAWKKLGQQWKLDQIEDLANRTLDGMPDPWLVPVYQPSSEPTILPPADQACSFLPHEIEGESSSASRPIISRDSILTILARSGSIQSRSGRDELGLTRRLGASWSVENALKNSTERSSILLDDDSKFNIHPSNSTSNLSFLRPQSRIIDVHDLRQALDGGQSTNNSRAPSIRSSSFRSPSRSQSHSQLQLTTSISNTERPRSRLNTHSPIPNGSARDLLNDIFSHRKPSASGAEGGDRGTEGVVTA